MPVNTANKHARLTLAFVDICNSTRLYEALGDDAAQARIGGMLDVLRGAAKSHGGQVVKEIGDESMLVFRQLADALEFVRQLPELQESSGLQCKTGLHSGEVILRGDDVFGDAVNTAARIVALAAPGQVLISESGIAQLPRHLRPAVRALPPMPVRGKREALRLVELAEDQDADYTQVVDQAQLQAVREGLATRLQLDWDGGNLEVDALGNGVSIGRDPGNAIALPMPQVSRVHLRIEQQGGTWLVRDQSTNGTQLLEEGARPVRLHREQHRLLYAGVLNLAPAQSKHNALVRYRVVQAV